MCPFCKSVNHKKTKIPETIFNNKAFGVLECIGCKLNYINPIPDNLDLAIMYQTSYQGEIKKENIDIEEKMPGLRFNYRYQLDLIKKYSANGAFLDFGCGTGHFVYNAELFGLKAEGVEYSKETVERLNSVYGGNKFFSVEDFYLSNKKNDCIRLSNVLEHFTDPIKEMNNLIATLNDKGVVVVEGPIEMNKSIVNWSKWNYLKLRKLANKSYKTFHEPTHIFFSNRKNQLAFFESLGLKTIIYKVKENAWPYPEKLKDAKSLLLFMKYLLGLKSKLIAKFSNKYGNTFIYVGRK